MPKNPLRLLKRRNRAAFDGRSSSERSPNGEVVRKPLYGGPWIGYPVRARTAKKEILVIGPRQVGKTTLALDIAEQRSALYLDREDRADREKLRDPALFLDR